MTVRILSLDTTAEFGSIALLEDGEVLDEVLLHAGSGFSSVLFEHLRGLLGSRGWTVADVDCFAAAAGPGSFTGIRVGLAAVKGLAVTLGKKVVAVSNLQAIASFGTSDLRAVCLDARRGQVYCAVYDSSLGLICGESLKTLPAWLASLPDAPVAFLSTDFSLLRQGLVGTPFEGASVVEVPRALAGAVGRIATERLKAGAVNDPARIDANYVRRSDAELNWREG